MLYIDARGKRQVKIDKCFQVLATSSCLLQSLQFDLSLPRAENCLLGIQRPRNDKVKGRPRQLSSKSWRKWRLQRKRPKLERKFFFSISSCFWEVRRRKMKTQHYLRCMRPWTLLTCVQVSLRWKQLVATPRSKLDHMSFSCTGSKMYANKHCVDKSCFRKILKKVLTEGLLQILLICSNVVDAHALLLCV